MANKKFTLLELHLADGAVRIGSRTPGEGPADAGADAESTENDAADGGTCPACTAGKLLLLVGGLAALVVVAAKLLGSDEDLDELEELEELADADE